MKMLSSVSVLSLSSCLLGVACSNSNGAETTGNAQPPGYNPLGIPTADNSVNGTAAITAAQAASLTNGTTACAQGSSVPQGGTPPIFEFVIDASGSMGDPSNPANQNSATKWAVFTQAIPAVFQSLPANFAVGVSYYNKPQQGCFAQNQAVPVGILTANQQTLISASLRNTRPQNYTPTYNAWLAGLNTLTAWQAPAGYVTSPRYIILITDGVPTVNRDGCATQNPITQTEYDAQIGLIQTAGQQAGVKTFVVGVVGSEDPQGATYDPRFKLSQLAVVGGTATAGCVPVTGTLVGNPSTSVNPPGTYCHFDLSQAADLGAALTSSLGSIAQSAISCNYAVPAPASGKTIDPASTVLVYNDGNGNYSLVLQNTSGTCNKGWRFTDATNSQIEICATTCSVLQQNPAASLQLIFGCNAGQIIN